MPLSPLRHLVLAVALLGCSSGSSATTDRANADTMATFMEAFAAAIEAGNGDCGAIADGLERVYQERGEQMKALGPWLDSMEGDSRRQVAFAEAIAPRMQAIRPQLEKLVACGDDPRIVAAQARLKALMK